MRLELPWPPTANLYWRLMRGHIVKSEAARGYKQLATLCFFSQAAPRDRIPIVGPVSVSVAAYRPARRGDIDNVLKVMLDSLQGLLYENDSQIVELHAFRYDDKANPRLVVTVEASK